MQIPETPRLFLAIDNCFASKRWCEVPEWMAVVKDLGIRYVEASADNEIDPLFSTPAHIDQWLKDVRKYSEEYGITVANLYSGHGTYSTLGLGHHDSSVRAHIEHDWVESMLRIAGELNAGLGFFAHAFSEKTLASPKLYEKAFNALIASFKRLASYAEESGAKSFGVEQMYSPHQVPWTIEGTTNFLIESNRKHSGLPVYITLDTGHQSGQDRFHAPSSDDIARLVNDVKNGQTSRIYVGPREFYNILRGEIIPGAALEDVLETMKTLIASHSYLFSKPGDGDTLHWLRRFAPYSPIIHLQQTDGKRSEHWNFTPELNERGIIRAPEILRAISDAYKSPPPDGFPPAVSEIYLTLEPFMSTASYPRAMLEDIAQSVEYWRRYIPEDGIELGVAVHNLSE